MSEVCGESSDESIMVAEDFADCRRQIRIWWDRQKAAKQIIRRDVASLEPPGPMQVILELLDTTAKTLPLIQTNHPNQYFPTLFIVRHRKIPFPLGSHLRKRGYRAIVAEKKTNSGNSCIRIYIIRESLSVKEQEIDDND